MTDSNTTNVYLSTIELQKKADDISKMLNGITLSEVRFILNQIEQNIERKSKFINDSSLFE